MPTAAARQSRRDRRRGAGPWPSASTYGPTGEPGPGPEQGGAAGTGRRARPRYAAGWRSPIQTDRRCAGRIPVEVAGLSKSDAAVELFQQPGQPGQWVSESRGEFGGVKQAIDDRGDDPATGLAAPPADPGLGALGEDQLGQCLAEQVRFGVSRWAREFLLAGFPAAPTRDEIASGHGDLEELGGRGPGRGLLQTHGRAPLEVRQVGGMMPDAVAARRKAALPAAAPVSYTARISRVCWTGRWRRTAGAGAGPAPEPAPR